MGSWTTEAAILSAGILLSAHVVASAIVQAFSPKSAAEPDATSRPHALSGESDGRVVGGRSWSDEQLAEREKRERPDTRGADPQLVDTFGLEEDERQAELERQLIAQEQARGAAP